MSKSLIVSAAATGEGKTLVTLALTRLLSQRAKTVPFKVGPDYLDARLYEVACGYPAFNVDLWLDGVERTRKHVRACAQDATFCIFEGMMGLFDGDDEGQTSTAHLARALGAPVVLVIDLWRTSQTAAAITLGCASFAPRVQICGVILNRVGGAAHERAVRSAFTQIGIPVLATLPYNPEWVIPERHLGLQTERLHEVEPIVQSVATLLAPQLKDWPFSEDAPQVAAQNTIPAAPARARVAVVNDAALWFTYPETRLALQAAGAQLIDFSILDDREIPADCTGLWMGGGYPELHAPALAENHSMRTSVRAAVQSGLPTYAECGGMMYLLDRIETADAAFPMAGALKGSTSMAEPRLHIGYRTARVDCDTPMDFANDLVRAYEFHYASSEVDEAPAYTIDGNAQGARKHKTVASFLHRHFLPGDAPVERFVQACVQ